MKKIISLDKSELLDNQGADKLQDGTYCACCGVKMWQDEQYIVKTIEREGFYRRRFLHVANECSTGPGHYAHNCKECVYLGEYLDVRSSVLYDLYFCRVGNMSIPTVLARYGDALAEYMSGLGSPHPALQEAERLAKLACKAFQKR